MNRYILLLILVLIGRFGFSQNETEIYKTVATKFEESYNAEDYENIFSMFSSDMKAAVPLDQLTQFLSGLQAQAGGITNREFIKYENGNVALYKTNFERALFGLNLSVGSDMKINGLMVKPFREENLPQIVRNITNLKLPFDGEWSVAWGGDTKELNYHVESEAQKNAFDLLIKDEKGLSYMGEGTKNEDYYAFGKNLFAPCDGEIVLVVDGIKDNIPGYLNPIYIPGNTVIIKTKNDEYLFFAHFKQHSIKVKQGQIVKQGDILGLSGNSGNSSEAHLHFHIQNVEDMNVATGVKCYFNNIFVNGSSKTDYSPIRGEKIRN